MLSSWQCSQFSALCFSVRLERMWRTKLLWSTSTPLQVTWSIGRRLASTGSGGVRRRSITRLSSSGSDLTTMLVNRWEVLFPWSLMMRRMVWCMVHFELNSLLILNVLDALDSNKDITLTSILGVEVSRCNDLTKEQLEQVFDYLVEKELE